VAPDPVALGQRLNSVAFVLSAIEGMLDLAGADLSRELHEALVRASGAAAADLITARTVAARAGVLRAGVL
jgi:hypothetical protein